MFRKIPLLNKIKRNSAAGEISPGINNDTASQTNRIELDKKLIYNLSNQRLPSFKQFKYIHQALPPKDKKIAGLAIVLILVSTLTILLNFYFINFTPTPSVGGEVTTGLVGAPQYINPILSQTNDVDSDISRLVFSGLLRYNQDLELEPDLATSWDISEDQKTYTFHLRDHVKWQDGEPFTADDVVFTYQSIEDTDFKSPLLISIRGVDVEKVDDLTVKFTLPQPYPSFLDVLTAGILPEHIWSEVPAVNANLTEYNLKPVGTGPWEFKSLTKDKLGNIKSYTIVPNTDYYGQKSYLQQITFKFYPDFQTAVAALKSHSIQGISFLPKELKSDLTGQKNLKYYYFDLPQYTAVFINQKKNEALKSKNVRTALAESIDKNKIVAGALQLEGAAIDGPIFPVPLTSDDTKPISYNIDDANQLLETAGWKKISVQAYQAWLTAKTEKASADDQANAEPSTATTTATEPVASDSTASQNQPDFYRQNGEAILELTLTTINQPENTQAADDIKKAWEKIGVKVTVQIVEPNKISRDIIRPRNYDVLLFGIIVGSNSDPFPFWHSSQVDDPGLNLSMYANREADKLLEDARATTDNNKKAKDYTSFQTLLNTDIPAIFLYKPTYTYVMDKDVKGVNIDRIIIPADRFNNIQDWYIKTVRTWHGQLK
ncbi:MAG: ABC transporter substrate-binding protein [Patescibacteria group bacterium]|nr:ABC transporter substrate-binding protein [Patescibacteria group bacterium]